MMIIKYISNRNINPRKLYIIQLKNIFKTVGEIFLIDDAYVSTWNIFQEESELRKQE